MNSCRASKRRCRLAPILCAIVVIAGQHRSVAQNMGMATPAQPQPRRSQVIQVANGPRGMVQLTVSGNAATITMPVKQSGAPTYSPQSGLQLNIDANWPGQYGYRPIRFKLSQKTPAVADRRITIEFTAGDWVAPRGRAISAEESFVFPAGATTVTETVLVPRYQDWQIATWRIKVDGRSDDFLGVDQVHFGSIAVGQAGVGVMSLGLSAQQFNDANVVIQNSSNGLSVNMVAMDGQPLPTNWVEYSSLDVFIMPAARFARLAADEPAPTAALLHWVRSGGNLWLTDSGGDWKRLPEVEAALGIEAQDDGDMSPEAAVKLRGWRVPTVGDRSAEPSEGALLLSGFDVGEQKNERKDMKESLGDFVEQFIPSSLNVRHQFVVRGYGLGVVTAFRTRRFNMANTFTQSLLGPRMTWASRYANQPDQSNDDFNNLLIPNVGVAPVGQFQFLMTLFVIVIGPLNYWLLQRKNKLPLLLATAPAAALATTILLFGYGILSDGFEVQARTRTLTLLDQRAGDAVSWGRLSYYAGIAPRDGLSVPRDQLMYPIMPRWSASRYGGRASSAPRVMVWDENQELTQGWLGSRTPTQYHAITSRPSKKQLDLRAGDKGLRVVNKLGVDVTHLAVEDHDGRFYWCENLADGKGLMVPVTEQDVLAKGIRQLFTANLPEAPDGGDGRYGNYGYALSQSLMEARLEAINSPIVQSWGRGKYIAFTQRAIELDLGLDGIAEEASFHVIEGTW